MKRYISVLALLLASQLYPQSKMDINNLIDRGGLLYAPNKEKPFSGSVFDLYDNGQKKLNGRYRNGIKNGKWTWWNVDGNKDSTGSYKNGLMNGIWQFYHREGSLKGKGLYKNGGGKGKWTYWHDNGQKQQEGTFKDGEKDGLWTWWWSNGQIKTEKTYRGGEEYLLSEWGENGESFVKDGKPFEDKYMVNVMGKSLEYAEKVLDLEGYKSTISDTLFSNLYEPGTIVGQYPMPNTKASEGRIVRLKIAYHEKLVTIPNLIGQSLRSAEITLQQAGLLIDTVYFEYNPEYPYNTIVWQYPKANDTMKKGFGIQVTVSKGLPPDYFYQVPNVIGLSLNQAKEYLAKARLKVGKISYHEDQDLVPYTVLDQSISKGTVLDRAMNIDLDVSILDLQDIFNEIVAAKKAEEEKAAAEAAQLLITLKQHLEATDQARSLVNSAKASLYQVEAQKKRMESLYKQKLISEQELESITAQHELTVNQLRQAKALLSSREDELSKLKMTAADSEDW